MNESRTHPLITIIVPIYRVEQYLDRCVKSLVNQTYTKIEILLVDDGSPDSCPMLCEEWGKRDTRIKVLHKENGGLSDARNYGIVHAKENMFLLWIQMIMYQLIISSTYMV